MYTEKDQEELFKGPRPDQELVSDVAGDLTMLGVNSSLAHEIGLAANRVFSTSNAFPIHSSNLQDPRYRFTGKGRYIPWSWGNIDIWIYLKGAGSVRQMRENLDLPQHSIDQRLIAFPQRADNMFFEENLSDSIPRIKGAMNTSEEGLPEYINTATALADYCRDKDITELYDLLSLPDCPVIPLFLSKDNLLTTHLNSLLDEAVQMAKKKYVYEPEYVESFQRLKSDFGVVAQIVPSPLRLAFVGNAFKPDLRDDFEIEQIGKRLRSNIQRGLAHTPRGLHRGNFYFPPDDKEAIESADFTDMFYSGDFNAAKRRHQLRRSLFKIDRFIPHLSHSPDNFEDDIQDYRETTTLMWTTILNGLIDGEAHKDLWWLASFAEQEFLHASASILESNQSKSRIYTNLESRNTLLDKYNGLSDLDYHLADLTKDTSSLVFDSRTRSISLAIKQYLSSGDRSFIENDPFLKAAADFATSPAQCVGTCLLAKAMNFVQAPSNTAINLSRRVREEMIKSLHGVTSPFDTMEIMNEYLSYMPVLMQVKELSNIEWPEGLSPELLERRDKLLKLNLKQPLKAIWETHLDSPSSFLFHLCDRVKDKFTIGSTFVEFIKIWKRLDHDEEPHISLLIADALMNRNFYNEIAALKRPDFLSEIATKYLDALEKLCIVQGE